MAVDAPALTPSQQKFVISKVTRRLIGFAFVCYVVAYVDRVNIGFAATALQRDLHLGDAAYGVGGGLFFLGYCLFEIPSNLLLERVGARLWIARIMIVWGLVSMATMFVTGQGSFYAARIVLGIAEAGFFPGMVLYLTYWIPAAERARTGALFMMAAPIAIIVGAPVSEALLSLDQRAGLAGWQWLFVLEGAPAVLLGVLALAILTDRPEQATWLDAREREWLGATMEAERAARVRPGHASVFAGFTSPKVWLLSTVYFLNTLVTYGVFLWLPKILRDLSGQSGWRLTVITSIPFVCALAGMILIGRHSDRTRERKGHVAACALIAATGLIIGAAFTGNLPLLVLSFAFSQVGQRSVMSVFWSIPPLVLGGTAAAAGIALINAIGNLGGFVGPSVMGWLRQETGGYAGGMLVLASGLLVAAGLVLTIKLPQEPRATSTTRADG
jgi:MFS transporter, ACS family, tartrate transporter